MERPRTRSVWVLRLPRDRSKPSNRGIFRTGGQVRQTPANSRFVIHRHSTGRTHFDLRVVVDGILRCWSLLREPPDRAGERRLAVERESFRVEAIGAARFNEEAFGEGRVFVWDEGEVEIAPGGSDTKSCSASVGAGSRVPTSCDAPAGTPETAGSLRSGRCPARAGRADRRATKPQAGPLGARIVTASRSPRWSGRVSPARTPCGLT